jgi:hypothetical protein
MDRVARQVLRAAVLRVFLLKVSFFEPTQTGSLAHLLPAAVLQWSFSGKRTPLQPQQQFSEFFVLVSRRPESIYYYSTFRVCTFENH